MNEIIEFAKEYMYFTAAMAVLNLILIQLVITKIIAKINHHISDAKAGRGEKKGHYTRYAEALTKYIDAYDKKEKKAGFYVKAKDKLKKAGYKSKYAVVIYLLLVFVLPIILSAAALLQTYTDFTGPLVLIVVIPVIVEVIIWNKKREIGLSFQLIGYKLYKYLHNQISAGVTPEVAIKTVYEVTDHKTLKDILIRFSAAFARTLDIDYAMEEFKSYFDIPEADTLCVALKQGIETGDNQKILARQESVMFSKYFNYIQAETEACHSRSAMAVLFFVAIIVIMILVPMIRDATEAFGKIFIN